MTASVFIALMMMLSPAAVWVEGTARCPTAREVASRVGTMLSGTHPGAAPDIATLEEVGAELRISLRRADGVVIGRRVLQRGATCAELAAAAAVVIATFESNVHPAFTLDLGSLARRTHPAPAREITGSVPSPVDTSVSPPSPPPPSLVGAAQERARSALPAVGRSPMLTTPPLRRPPPAATASVAVATSPPDPSPGSNNGIPTATATATAPPPSTPMKTQAGDLDLSAAFTAAFASVPGAGGNTNELGSAAGGTITGSWTRRSLAWGIHALASGETERSAGLPSGDVRWRRLSLGVGLHRRWVTPARRWIVEVHAEGLAGLLGIRGTGFVNNRSRHAFEPGAAVGTRLIFQAWGSATGESLRPWVGVSAKGWPVRQEVYEQPSQSASQLPRYDLLLAVGLLFAPAP